MKTTYPINNERKNAEKDIISEKASKTYRKEIDGLRAIAVIAVIINHFNQDLLPGGFLGVDIFFVISGYVITKSLQRQKSSNLRQLLAGFYERRIKRLFPALAVCLLITSLAVAVVNPQPLQSLRTGLAATIGASNIYLIKNSTNYFAQSAELNPFLHTWSLAVEEQFYLVYPILFWLCTKQKRLDSSLGLLPATLWILSTLSLTGAIAIQNTNPDAAYFGMPFRFWEMAAGCLLCSELFNKYPQSLTGKSKDLLCYISIAILIGLFFISKIFILPITIASVIFTCIFILTSDSKSSLPRLLSNDSVVYAGALSYSLYLWHWPILSIARWTIGVTSQTVFPLIISIIAASMASYHFIEKPLRHRSWDASSAKSITKGLVVILATASSIFTVIKFYPNIYKATNQEGISNYKKRPVHWKDQQSQYATIINKCHVQDNGSLTKAHIIECLTPVSSNKQNMAFVIGDSHAVNHYFGIQQGLSEFNVGLFTAGWGCGVIPIENARKIAKFDCIKYVNLVNDFLASNTVNGDIIFIGMRWLHKKPYETGVKNTIREMALRMKKKGVNIIILDDVPELPDVTLCTPRWYRPKAGRNPLCEKSIQLVDNELKGLSSMARSLEHDHSNVSFLRLRDAFCPNDRCSVFDGETPLYFDEGHLTSESSKRNAKRINDYIKALN